MNPNPKHFENIICRMIRKANKQLTIGQRITLMEAIRSEAGLGLVEAYTDQAAVTALIQAMPPGSHEPPPNADAIIRRARAQARLSLSDQDGGCLR